MKRICHATMLVLFVMPLLTAQDPQWEWVRALHTGDSETATAVASDPNSGEIYLAGEWRGAMAICVYDQVNSLLQYAGGFNPLVLVRNGKFDLFKADPMPIGIGAITGKDFTRHDIRIQKDDVIYLYSDGYEDQFGGDRDKKFSRKRFRNLLLDIHSKPMTEQKKSLEGTLDQWMDGREQIDDITVMGIRF